MKFWFVEHRNLKNIFLKSNHESDNSIEGKNQLKCLKDVKTSAHSSYFFKVMLKEGCLVDALAIRGDEGRERLR